MLCEIGLRKQHSSWPLLQLLTPVPLVPALTFPSEGLLPGTIKIIIPFFPKVLLVVVFILGIKT